jgi:hypothetical protein
MSGLARVARLGRRTRLALLLGRETPARPGGRGDLMARREQRAARMGPYGPVLGDRRRERQPRACA